MHVILAKQSTNIERDEINMMNIFNDKTFISVSSSSSSSSSSLCRAASTDIPDPLSPLLPIVHRLWQGYIPYPHIAAVYIFELVVLLLLGHMWGSIGLHHL